jgi:hypothetical protein
MKPKLFSISGIVLLFIIFNSCVQPNREVNPKAMREKYFNAEFDGLTFKSKEPSTALDILTAFNQSFIYNGIQGNFNNIPANFNATIEQKGEHWTYQRFFIRRDFDTLMVDIDIEFPIIGGESQIFTKKTYSLGLFLRDPTIDIPNALGAKVWSGKCPTPENPQPSISVSVYGKRKTDGKFGVVKYWQTVKSVPHNDVGTIIIEEIDTVNKTVKGSFSSTISSQYFNMTLDQFNKIVDPTCKPELYTVDKSKIKGDFLLPYK